MSKRFRIAPVRHDEPLAERARPVIGAGTRSDRSQQLGFLAWLVHPVRPSTDRPGASRHEPRRPRSL